MEQEIKNHGKKIAGMQEQIKTLFGYQEDSKRRTEAIYKLAASVEVLTAKMTETVVDVEEIKKDVKEMKGKSGKKWDDMVSNIIRTTIAVVIGYLFANYVGG